ncbi:hypothetical protein N7280_02005, partial [Rickettsia rhipicephali]|uniref:hypothetical protein n=1 Tax=Rickettsia rhipicephali TaxID=33992 RepID=UPI002258ACB7
FFHCNISSRFVYKDSINKIESFKASCTAILSLSCLSIALESPNSLITLPNSFILARNLVE